MPTRSCIFCSGRPLTREHVYPSWLSTVLRKRLPENVPPGIRLGFGTDQHESAAAAEPVRTLVHPKELRVLARCVCAPCNHGWMRDIEEAARVHMEPMILGRDYKLTPESQAALSAWIALRAMIIPYAHTHQVPVRDDWLKWMYENHTAPPGWRVWAAAYAGRVPTFYEASAITTWQGSSPGIPRDGDPLDHGLTVDFAAGYLALKVVGLDRFPFENPRWDYMLRLLPSPGVALQWPPRRIFTDETIERYITMFLSDGARSAIRRHFEAGHSSPPT